jgi:hypothetical protein
MLIFKRDKSVREGDRKPQCFFLDLLCSIEAHSQGVMRIRMSMVERMPVPSGQWHLRPDLGFERLDL